MKRKWKGVFWGCMGVVFLAVGICFLTKLTAPRNGYDKYKEFVDESDMYDVLFFGNSHMANAVYPMELWHNYGVASYNRACFGAPLPVTYWVMMDALDYAQPDMVVVDCYSIGKEEKAGADGMMHAAMDGMPLNRRKIRMIQDLLDDPKDRLEYYWNFAVYHDRWWDLDQEDFERRDNLQKGAQIAFEVVSPQEMAPKPAELVETEKVGAVYLRQIIEECQKRDIDILLTYLPFPATEDAWQEALLAEQIAGEYGVPYINFLDKQVVDLETDCSDKDSHLNGSGGRKVTEYIGEYIGKHYVIADHRGEEMYAGWDEDYRCYMDYKFENMKHMETLEKYLAMLADPAFSCCIYVDGNAAIWQQNERYLPLFDNVADGRTEKLEEAAASGKDYFLVVDNGTGKVQEGIGGERLFAVEEKGGADVQITVMNRQDGRILDEKSFGNGLKLYTE